MNPHLALELIARQNQMVEFSLVDADGTGNKFETEQAITDTPTLLLTPSDPYCKRFEITEIMFYMNPANAVTPEILLFEDAVADNVTSLSKIVWTSGAGMVDSTRYVRTNNEDELPKIVNLAAAGKLYYMMIWTGAPGNTPGYIKVKGRKMG